LKFNKDVLFDTIISGLLTLLMLFSAVKFVEIIFSLTGMEKTGGVYVNAFVWSVVAFSGAVNYFWFEHGRFKVDKLVKRFVPASKKEKLEELSKEADKLKEA
jgi:hypothetical protein